MSFNNQNWVVCNIIHIVRALDSIDSIKNATDVLKRHMLLYVALSV